MQQAGRNKEKITASKDEIKAHLRTMHNMPEDIAQDLPFHQKTLRIGALEEHIPLAVCQVRGIGRDLL